LWKINPVCDKIAVICNSDSWIVNGNINHGMKGKPVLILRIKQAEIALADGRLDEAFEIVRSEHVRNHYRGQKLISRLSAALAKRGRDNFEAERIQDALADCSKAEKLAGNTDEVANLRSDICSRMEEKRLREQHCSLNLAQAKRNIQAGWISAGEKILEQTDEDNSRAGIVIQQANLARIQIDEGVALFAEPGTGKTKYSGRLDFRW